MKIQRINPVCNLDTIRDDRGGIFTFLPDDPIVEFNFIFIKSLRTRGEHYHPEFDEYFLLTAGEGVMITKDSPDAKEEFLYLSKGQCSYAPKNTPHVFYAITDCTAVALLTKRWDDCNPPIIHSDLGMGVVAHHAPSD